MQLTHEEYNVGWIAALAVELAPARALLDEQHEDLERLPGDNNTYILGRIGKHNVVITGLPEGVIGTNAAGNTAKDLLRTFRNVRFGLMVGIGGGVPSEDVRLGDIVVSTRKGRSGGVVQYDFGTRLQRDDSQQGSFVNKGFLRDPPTALQTAVTKLRSKAMVDGYEYPQMYEKMLTDKPRMKRKFQKPTTDVLYKADYVHQGGDDCSTCDILHTVKRYDRDSDEEQVHFGPIGSGNQVIRDALFRDKVYKDEKIICFEMEAAGLMEDFECLVIRGICDYCDSHKNKIWQPYAAAVAAAYAKELLLTLPPQQVEDMPKSKILQSISGDLKEIKAQNAEVITIHRSSALANAIKWVAAPNPDSDFSKAQQRKEFGTGTWIIESKSYVQWKSGNVRHLWVHGKAGCGKSTLTATAIPDIRNHCANIDAGFAMFYFIFSDIEKQSWKSCLKSLVTQLGERVSSMLIQAHQASRGPPSEELLTNILLAAINSHKEVFIVLDALDESPEVAEGDETVRSILLNKLVSLSANALNVKFFLTSRELVDIRQSIKQLTALQIPMAAEFVNSDIRKYVVTQLNNGGKLSTLNPKLKESIEVTITEKADGMFRWAYCQMHQLKRLKLMRATDIARALKTLSKTLDETYERMLNEIDQDLEAAVVLVRWLAYARRPLTLHELAEAITIELHPDEDVVDTENRPVLEGIMELLSGLVTIKINDQDKATDGSDVSNFPEDLRTIHVELAHFSIKEYLESERSAMLEFHLVADRDQHFLSNCCLVYIMDYAESEKKLATVEDLEAFPLLEYAAKSWYKHYPITGDTNQRVISFLQTRKAIYSWNRVGHLDESWRKPFEDESVSASLQGLYVASYVGLNTVVKELIELNISVDAQGGRYGNALQAAVVGGHEQTIKILIQAGADVNAKGGAYGNALQASALYGQEKIVKMLIEEYGADINARGGDDSDALQAAVVGGYEQMAKMLIEQYGADVNAQGGEYGSALQAAVVEGHKQIAKMLIEDYGANVNVQCGKYDSILQAAAYCTEWEIFKMLIEDYGADVNIPDSKGMTEMHFIVNTGNMEIYDWLLATGKYDLTIKDKYGRALIDHACISRSTELIKRIIEHSQPVRNVSSSEWSTMHWACRKGSFEDLLLLNNAGYRGWTVETDQPKARWAPLDVAVYYKNRNLISPEGNFIESHKWASLLQSGLVRSTSDFQEPALAIRKNSLESSSEEDSLCDGCFSDIHGLYFRCENCGDVDYCFMCRYGSEASHPGHEWECLGMQNEGSDADEEE